MIEERHHAVSRHRRPAMLLLALVAGIAAYFALERGELNMSPSALAASFVAAKPPIDTFVPKKTATATFAMG